MTTKILSCSCKHEFQDSQYGIGRRVMNRMAKTINTVLKRCGYKCTVCGKITESSL